MEIILATATILGGIAAIWFFIEKYREKKTQQKPPMKIEKASTKQSKAQPENPSTPIYGATQSGRYPFFISEPFTELKLAKEKSKKINKPVFLVIYNNEHPTRSKLFYSLGCFLDYFTTKQLVEEHFISAIVSTEDKDAKSLVPEDNPLENCLWVVLSPTGAVLRQEGVYANSDVGLRRVREVISDSGA